MQWTQAGGDPRKLALYGQLAQVQGIVSGGGRVLASINPAHHPTGALGDLTGGRETLEAGEAWLREQGCQAVQGPLEVATWFPYRANLGPWDERPFVGEPLASPGVWLASGYREVARYASALCENARAVAYGRSKQPKGLSLRPMTTFEEDLPIIHRLVLASFRDAYAYSPLPLEGMAALYAPLQQHLVPDLVLIAETPEGTPVGFVFGLPDLWAPRSGRFLVKTLAVLPEHRRGGTGAWLVGELHAVADRMGFTHGIHALMWQGSRSRNISQHGGRVFREYALYMKAL